jgi:uncharacterized protein
VRIINQQTWRSPSDVLAAATCPTRGYLAAQLDLPTPPARPDTALAATKGAEHEARVLGWLSQIYGPALDLSVPPPTTLAALLAADAATATALAQGSPLIYQPTFADPVTRLTGRADFLIRTSTDPLRYEVVDAKLAATASTDAAAQVAFYSSQLARLTGHLPTHAHLVLGSDEITTLRVDQVLPYWEMLARTTTPPTTEPYPLRIGACAACLYEPRCDAVRTQARDLSLVAGLRSDQRSRLTTAGITTIDDLATASVPPATLAQPVFAHLRTQAAAQVASARTGTLVTHHSTTQQPDPPTGLYRLPLPDPGDLYLDFEGDPFYAAGGLEYLTGVAYHDPTQPDAYGYQAFWAHDRPTERQALGDLVDFVAGRQERYPTLSIYHYAPYERSALHRLARRHHLHEQTIIKWQDTGLLVDLYRVVHEGVVIGAPSYSLKVVERAYRGQRTGDVQKAIGSVVEYEAWRNDSDPLRLTALESYNRDDCVSTGQLHAWLELQRSQLSDPAAGRPVRPEYDPAPSQSRLDRLASLELLADRLRNPPPMHTRKMACAALADLVGFCARERSAAYSDWFRRHTASPAEAIAAHDVLGGLVYERELGPDKRSLLRQYRFVPQEHPIAKPGSQLTTGLPPCNAGTLVSIDDATGTLVLKQPASLDPTSVTTLVADRPVSTDVIESRIVELADRTAGEELTTRDLLILDLLARTPPRVAGVKRGELLAGTPAELALALEYSYLAIQGPPGSGKTYQGAQIIAALVGAGLRVGITAPSHAVAANLITTVLSQYPLIRVAHRHPLTIPQTSTVSSAPELADLLAYGEVDVVSGSTWNWTHAAWLSDPVDVLVVDEAAQYSLAHLTAIAASAHNLVLLGDPAQLPQVTQAIHPGLAASSALGHLCGPDATIDPTLGVFLDTTWRMRPELTAVVSKIAYASQLSSHPSTTRRQITQADILLSGVIWLPVSHTGNRVSSTEEAAALAAWVRHLLDHAVYSDGAVVRPLTPADFCVVAPFNAHVRTLSAALIAIHPSFADRIGSVDRFQGREAPISVYAMGASSAEDLPRGQGFLYDPARLNVALSRGQCLAAIVASPTLLRTHMHDLSALRGLSALLYAVSVPASNSPSDPLPSSARSSASSVSTVLDTLNASS